MEKTSLWANSDDYKLADDSSSWEDDEMTYTYVCTSLVPAKEMPLNKDAWTQALLALLLYHDKAQLTCDQKTWIVTSMLLYLVNVILQIGLMMMILLYVVDPMEASTKPPIFDMNAAAELLRDPRLQGQTLEGSESYQVSSEQAELVLSKCKILDPPGLVKAQLFMLFLWNTRILKEVADNARMTQNLRHCDRRNSLDQQLVEDSTLVRVDSYVLWLSKLVVQLPMLVIDVLLWAIGSRLIVFGILPFTVVLKGLALQFLVTIDEMIFETFAARKAHELLGEFKVKYRPGADWPKWNSWGSSVFKFSLVAGLTAFTMFFLFADLPNFRSACGVYKVHAPDSVVDKMH